MVVWILSIGAVSAWHFPALGISSPRDVLLSTRRNVWRTALPIVVATTTTITGTTLWSDPVYASLLQPLPKGITTVILESADTKLGVQLEDVGLGRNRQSYPVVKSISPNGIACTEGVVPGMIVLGQTSSRSLVERLQRGPYPYAIQFYDLSVEMDGTKTTKTTANAALEQFVDEAAVSRSTKNEPPPLSTKGTGLVVKTTLKASGDCTIPARRGDTVTIVYEGRVASPGGPVYDSTLLRGGQPVTFRLGEGKAIAGVEIGIGGMCQGEVREIDIPSALGYGRFGSDVFDVPGDVRLWWRVELLDLVEGEKRFPFR